MWLSHHRLRQGLFQTEGQLLNDEQTYYQEHTKNNYDTVTHCLQRKRLNLSKQSSFSNHRKLRPEESAKKAAATARSNSSAIIIHNYSPEN